MPFKYSSAFRRDVCQRLLAGEAVASLANELQVRCVQTFARGATGLSEESVGTLARMLVFVSDTIENSQQPKTSHDVD